MSQDLATFGGGPALAWKGVQTALLLAFAIGALYLIGRSGGAIAFAVFCFVGGCYNLLLAPFMAILDRHDLLFRSVARTQTFNIEDLRRVKQHRGPEGTGSYWTFSFTHGSAWLNGSAGERLARRLVQLNPGIPNDAL
jgi:hypothetical protein